MSWWKFFLLSVALMIIAGVAQDFPPFKWTTTETVIDDPQPPAKPKPPAPPRTPTSTAPATSSTDRSTDRSIADDVEAEVQRALKEAREALANRKGRSGALIEIDYDDEEVSSSTKDQAKRTKRVTSVTTTMGDALPNLAFLWIVLSGVLKGTYKGRLKAEARAAQASQAAEAASETAEAEALKRQLVEARLATMQAQVEPHFLFNTLASIDHLIETDPKRASQMQKSLIALLRASMPSLRQKDGSGLRTLGTEMALITPYLEILKVRMEDRLQTSVQVSEGLRSAAFPPLMLQGLVENAIKHGLEPKPEGGRLDVSAEVVHGKLVVSVTDTGLGFGAANTAGTGVGLQNIRERLALLFEGQGKLEVMANQPAGTRVRITVPYRSLDEA
jgi:signal transduction histidine kinase